MNFNLLRPVVFSELKVGEVLQAYSGLPPTVAYKASTFAVLKFEDGSEGCYEIYKLETSYKLVPLCWVESKPVYPGDELYRPAVEGDKALVVSHVTIKDEIEFLYFSNFGDASEYADNRWGCLTWTKPEQKREPSFQVEGQDVFPGDPVYYYGETKRKWGKEYTVETDNSVTRNGDQLPVKSFIGGEAAFRLKPMLVIGDHLVPMPVRDAAEMKKGDNYYTPCLDSDIGYLSYTWSNHSFDFKVCDKGLVHRTKEAAIAHTEAFIALSKKKDQDHDALY